MRNLARNVLVVAASLAPASAFAHPGPHRNEAAWMLLHAVTNADHLLLIGAGGAFLVSIAAVLLAATFDRIAVASVDAR